MTTPLILSNFTPAIMLFLVAMATRFFPPTKEGSAITISAPEWWRRDQKTWESAYKFLSKRYLQYSILLAGICVVFLFFDLSYGATIGYLLLIAFFAIAQVQVRHFMNTSIK